MWAYQIFAFFKEYLHFTIISISFQLKRSAFCSEYVEGCFGTADISDISVTFYGYNSNGNRGIAAGLGNIQKLRDGESLGGRAKASEEFDTEDVEDFLA